MQYLEVHTEKIEKRSLTKIKRKPKFSSTSRLIRTDFISYQ